MRPRRRVRHTATSHSGHRRRDLVHRKQPHRRYHPVGLGLQEVTIPSNQGAFDLCSTSTGDVWFTANNGPTSQNVYQITGTPGSYTLNTFVVAANANLTGIACGVDNAIWYLDAFNNEVGRISLAAGNAQTTYAIPDLNFQPQYITSGQDGSLWYTSGNLDMVGHITP